MDVQAKAFGLVLSPVTREILHGYVSTCVARLLELLAALAGHCNKGYLDAHDVHYMKVLSKMFLAFEPKPTAGNKRSNSGYKTTPQRGGAETTMAGAFFGDATAAGAYAAAAAGLGTVMSVTADAARPGIPMQQAGGGSSSVTGGATAMQRRVLAVLLAEKGMPEHPALREDAEKAMAFIVGCNVLNLLTRIKTLRKGHARRRGAPVTAKVMDKAILQVGFVIPV